MDQGEKPASPVKGDLIWVRNYGMLSWLRRTFSHKLRSGGAACYIQHGLNIDYDDTHGWDEYSIYDPR